MHPSKRVLWLIARQATGWILIGVGIAGLVLPILPGWALIGWGVITLAPDFPFLRLMLARLERKVPQLKGALRRIRRRRRSEEPASAGADGQR
jgi:uncharacterized membrane protein YbaN (DUF454 family)